MTGSAPRRDPTGLRARRGGTSSFGGNSPGPPPLAGEGFALLLAGRNQLRAAARRGANLRAVARRERSLPRQLTRVGRSRGSRSPGRLPSLAAARRKPLPVCSERRCRGSPGPQTTSTSHESFSTNASLFTIDWDNTPSD
jgi:hypothetical protein